MQENIERLEELIKRLPTATETEKKEIIEPELRKLGIYVQMYTLQKEDKYHNGKKNV